MSIHYHCPFVLSWSCGEREHRVHCFLSFRIIVLTRFQGETKSDLLKKIALLEAEKDVYKENDERLRKRLAEVAHSAPGTDENLTHVLDSMEKQQLESDRLHLVEVTELKENLEARDRELASLEEKLNSLQKNFSEVTEFTDAKIDELTVQCTQADGDKDRLEQEVTKLKARIKAKDEELDNYVARTAETQECRGNQDLEKLEHTKTISELMGRVEQLTKDNRQIVMEREAKDQIIRDMRIKYGDGGSSCSPFPSPTRSVSGSRKGSSSPVKRGNGSNGTNGKKNVI